MDTQSVNRRNFLKTSAIVAAGVAAAPLARAAVDGKPSPVVETAYGKVRGTVVDGVHIFKGIHYGGDTGGKNRFLPPTKPKSWSGVKETTEYGHIAPQSASAGRIDYVNAIRWYDQPGGQSEDCLVLNVWSPGVNDGGKRPVLVCFHGGGFTSGSGNHEGFNGENQARIEDVVCVSVNHRLGVLGYLHLADLGAPDKYRYSGVAGMLDLVAALEWVRENIENFGGDPDTVMIFGQSGGGAKTSTLQAMPGAKGLFHRAGIQSGSSLRMREPEAATRSTEALLGAMGLSKNRLMELRDIPFEMLISAQAALSHESPPASFSPVVGSDALPRHPFDPDAPDVSAHVPIVVGTTLDDAALALTNWDLDMDGLRKMAKGIAGDKADTIVTAYREAYPEASPYLLQARMLTDRGFRRGALAMAARKAEQPGAPAYMYLVNFVAPWQDGKFGAVHGVDVSLVLNNYGGGLTGSSRAAKRLARQMGGMWAQFARTGDPNIDDLPNWPTYNTTSRPTMIFDKECKLVNDPGGQLHKLWADVQS